MNIYIDYSDYISNDIEYSLAHYRAVYGIDESLTDEEARAVIAGIEEVTSSDRYDYLSAIGQ